MQVTWPLHELNSGENMGKNKAATAWDDRCQQSFGDLKHLCTTVHIPAYADFTRPFKLHTDACGSGFGAVLYQTHDDGMDAVIAYASRNLMNAEPHYPAHKLEFVTLKWAVVKKFHEYLYGSTFDVYPDNNTLTCVLTMAKLDTASHCWLDGLANYNFQLYYRVGKTNINMDALSGVSWSRCMPNTSDTHIQVTVVAVWDVQEATLDSPISPIKAYSSNLCILDSVEDSPQVICMTTDDWQHAQIQSWVLSLQGYRWELWVNASSRQLILLSYNSSLGSTTTSHWGEVFSIGRFSSNNPKRPCSSWFNQLHRGRLLYKDATRKVAL